MLSGCPHRENNNHWLWHLTIRQGLFQPLKLCASFLCQALLIHAFQLVKASKTYIMGYSGFLHSNTYHAIWQKKILAVKKSDSHLNVWLLVLFIIWSFCAILQSWILTWFWGLHCNFFEHRIYESESWSCLNFETHVSDESWVERLCDSNPRRVTRDTLIQWPSAEKETEKNNWTFHLTNRSKSSLKRFTFLMFQRLKDSVL